jgi:hypothetical protein
MVKDIVSSCVLLRGSKRLLCGTRLLSSSSCCDYCWLLKPDDDITRSSCTSTRADSVVIHSHAGVDKDFTL